MALTRIEQTVEKVGPVDHPNLLRVFGYETVDRGSFLVVEWTEGFSLLELLKARRVLQAEEALKLLSQAAEGIDYALGLGLSGLDLGLHQVQIHFSQPIEKETAAAGAAEHLAGICLEALSARRNTGDGQFAHLGRSTNHGVGNGTAPRRR